jgi:chromosomal replication initiation ATPase DnaA
LMLIGQPGTGKGHLASAIVRYLRRSFEWRTHVDLVNEFHGLDFQERVKYVGQFRRVPVLVIDEMGGKNLTADTEELFFSILNLRYEEGLKTLIVGNIPWRTKVPGKLDMASIVGSARAESRFADTLATTINCQWEDARTRATAAKPLPTNR